MSVVRFCFSKMRVVKYLIINVSHRTQRIGHQPVLDTAFTLPRGHVTVW